MKTGITVRVHNLGGSTLKTFDRYTRELAIRQHCLSCMNCQALEIRDCQNKECALWVYRPFQTLRAKFDTTNNPNPNQES